VSNKTGAAAAARIAAASMWMMTEALERHVDAGLLSKQEEDLIEIVLETTSQYHDSMKGEVDEYLEADPGSTWMDWVHLMLEQMWSMVNLTRDTLSDMLDLHMTAGTKKPPAHLIIAYMSVQQAHSSIDLYSRVGEVDDESPTDADIEAWLESGKKDEG